MRGLPSLLTLSLAVAPLVPCPSQAPPAPAPPPPPQGPPPALVLVKAGRLVDGRSSTVQSNVGILVEGERIKAIGPLAQVQAQAGSARVIDLSGRFPKHLTDKALDSADLIITLGCGDACPILPGKHYLDWAVADPHGRGNAFRRHRGHHAAPTRSTVHRGW